MSAKREEIAAPESRVCRRCRFPRGVEAFEGESTICELCDGPHRPGIAVLGDNAWLDVDAVVAGERSAPAAWDSFRRTGDLEAWSDAGVADLRAGADEAERHLKQVEETVIAIGRQMDPRAQPSIEWSLNVGFPVVLAWEYARRAAGRASILDGIRAPKVAPLSGTTAALARLFDDDPRLGVSGGRWVEAEPSKRDKECARGKFRLAVAADREEDLGARAYAAARGRSRPLDADGNEAPGFLPVEWMPAKQSSNGCTGGSAHAADLELRADIERAVAEAEIDGLALEWLRLADLGEWQLVPAARRRGYVDPKKGHGVGQRELVRLKLYEIADRYPGVDVEKIQDRVAAARRRLAEELQRMGLIPPMRPRGRVQTRLEREGPGLARTGPIEPTGSIGLCR